MTAEPLNPSPAFAGSIRYIQVCSFKFQQQKENIVDDVNVLRLSVLTGDVKFQSFQSKSAGLKMFMFKWKKLKAH